MNTVNVAAVLAHVVTCVPVLMPFVDKLSPIAFAYPMGLRCEC